MKEIVEFVLEDGTSIYIEVSNSETTRKLGKSKTIKKAKAAFNQVISSIGPTTEVIMNKMKSLSSSPDEISVEFGIKVSGSLDFAVISSDLDTNFKVNLKWKKV